MDKTYTYNRGQNDSVLDIFIISNNEDDIIIIDTCENKKHGLLSQCDDKKKKPQSDFSSAVRKHTPHSIAIV